MSEEEIARQVEEDLSHPCEHEGCTNPGVPCFYPLSDKFPESDAYYCAEHCFAAGFCSGCGNFQAGIESFDFGNGLCYECRSSDYDDDGDCDEDDDYFSYIPYDEVV